MKTKSSSTQGRLWHAHLQHRWPWAAPKQLERARQQKVQEMCLLAQATLQQVIGVIVWTRVTVCGHSGLFCNRIASASRGQ